MRRMRFVIGIAIGVAAILYLVLSGSRETLVYYITVRELKAKGVAETPRDVRVLGEVVNGSIRSDPSILRVEFVLVEGSDELPVRYRGVVPDTFKDGADVVVTGRFGSDGVFEARELLAKCPSKYEGQPFEEAAGKGASS